MAWGTVERLDHWGLIAEVIKDLGLRALMDARLVPDAQEDITPGEAVAGMILHGLGCAHRPLSLPPQFLTQKPLDLLWRQGVRAERCNRFQRGRTLDEVHPYGCDRVLRDMALAVCAHEGLDLRCKPLDTPRCALTGASVPESAAPVMTITPGHSKDHRPDVQQAVWALLVSQDGGGPCVSTSGDGKTSETPIVHERAQALMTTLQTSPTPRSLVADSQRYNEDKAATLQALGFLTRMPHTLKLVSQVITPALRWDTWQPLEAGTR